MGLEIRGPGDHPPDLQRQTRGCHEIRQRYEPGAKTQYPQGAQRSNAEQENVTAPKDLGCPRQTKASRAHATLCEIRTAATFRLWIICGCGQDFGRLQVDEREPQISRKRLLS